jgi:cytochrome oxidase Cu insertion factor (SCO1/SenC/PrrC family)
LEYQLRENTLTSEKDPDIVKNINKLKDEMKQIQIQLIDVPVDENNDMTEEQLNEYFNSNKVNKKYKLKH